MTASKKIGLSMKRSTYAALCARAERDGLDINEALDAALSAHLETDDPDEERLSPGEKQELFDMMARDPRLEGGAQDETEEQAIAEEVKRVLTDEIAEEEMGEAERDEHERKKMLGRRNPLLGPSAKDWARR